MPSPADAAVPVPAGGVPLPAGAGPGVSPMVVAAPNGGLGLDTNGDGVMDTPLPAKAGVVRTPGGASAVDLNGDGAADVDMGGNAVPGGSAPPGSRLVTGADGLGYDVNGDGVPDLDLNGNAYVCGGTTSTDFPTSVGAPQSFYAGHGGDNGGGPVGDAFVADPRVVESAAQ